MGDSVIQGEDSEAYETARARESSAKSEAQRVAQEGLLNPVPPALGKDKHRQSAALYDSKDTNIITKAVCGQEMEYPADEAEDAASGRKPSKDRVRKRKSMHKTANKQAEDAESLEAEPPSKKPVSCSKFL